MGISPLVGSRSDYWKSLDQRAGGDGDRETTVQAGVAKAALPGADGWYEWQRLGNTKQPYLLQFSDGRAFAFAGLWERWEKSESPIESCTILTTAAAESLADIHDRMPLILGPTSYDAWLNPVLQEPERISPLLSAIDHEQLERYPVSTWVNNPRHEGPLCAEPL